MSFYAPSLLVLLLVVPLAAGAYALLESRRDRRAAAWSSPALLPNMVERPPSVRRHLPFALLLVGLALLLVGFARPQAKHTVKRQQATAVVVLDVSGSMAADDLRPSRLAAAKALAGRLVDALPKGYRISLEVFSDHSAVVVPPTDDLARVRAVLAAVKAGPQGTALADAVFHAVDVAHTAGVQTGTKSPASIVVLSDGGATAGRIQPRQAARRAATAHVPVFAVAIGTPQGVVHQKLKGGYTEQIQVPMQPTTLRFLAGATGGHFYARAGQFDPHAVFRNLGARAGTKRERVEVTAVAAGGGIAFMLAGAALSGLWFRRLA